MGVVVSCELGVSSCLGWLGLAMIHHPYILLLHSNNTNSDYSIHRLPGNLYIANCKCQYSITRWVIM